MRDAGSSALSRLGFVESEGCYVQMHPSKAAPEQPGKVFLYPKVGPEDFAKFDAAESKGKHYATVIKPQFGPGELVTHIDVSGSEGVGVPPIP